MSKAINGIEQFTEKEVSVLNEFAFNNYSDIGIVSKGRYEGYKMTVKLNFILGDDYISTRIKAEDDVIGEARVGNLISKSTVGMNRNLSKEGNVKLKDGYRLVYQYSRYSGIVFVPLKGNDLYSSDCSNGINFQDYPNIRIAMPIYSGYTDE